MAQTTQPEIVANVIAIFVGCVAAFVSIASKVLSSRRRLSKLWISTEIGSCIIAGFIGWETADTVVKLLPFMTKPLHVVICVYLGSSLVLRVAERTIKNF